MSQPPDPPPADERSPGYYERMFGERISKVSRAEERPAKQAAGNGGKVGAGVLVAIVLVVLRLVVGLNRTSTTPQTPLPPAPRWQAPALDKVPAWEVPLPDGERRIEELEQQDFILPQPHPEAFLLQETDVPILRGLCYRIDRQSRQARESPGKRIWHFLDAEGRRLVHEAADHRDLVLKPHDDPWQPPASAPRILKALNAVLRQPELYQRASFREVHLPAGLRGLAEEKPEDRAPGDVIPLNRWLLEAAYHEQIIPQHVRHDLDAQRLWRIRALTDIVNAAANPKLIDP